LNINSPEIYLGVNCNITDVGGQDRFIKNACTPTEIMARNIFGEHLRDSLTCASLFSTDFIIKKRIPGDSFVPNVHRAPYTGVEHPDSGTSLCIRREIISHIWFTMEV